jgi:hypothetical protein
MGKSTVEMIAEFGRQVEDSAGPEVREQVMAGSEDLTARTSAEETSLWVRDAIGRLDRLVAEQTAVKIMETCGANCARVNSGVIERAKKRSSKHANEEAFLEAERRKPQAGTRLEREGAVLYQTYTPQAFTRPMRCYCALLRALPENETVSRTYCHCSKAFVKTFWEEALGRPVRVEILESAVSGSNVCKFKITPV